MRFSKKILKTQRVFVSMANMANSTNLDQELPLFRHHKALSLSTHSHLSCSVCEFAKTLSETFWTSFVVLMR
ncbi:hypothetical protein TorRG33x02_268560 [Trema orientale]|uniref:Uncharacterized protein n=1 Tax=Trema orientale TaxID=63057 RepID=A0A2P5CYP6_TREOI|nr:hypothetical protein TorRG33x02_268560 [Trema orientale]